MSRQTSSSAGRAKPASGQCACTCTCSYCAFCVSGTHVVHVQSISDVARPM